MVAGSQERLMAKNKTLFLVKNFAHQQIKENYHRLNRKQVRENANLVPRHLLGPATEVEDEIPSRVEKEVGNLNITAQKTSNSLQAVLK